MSVLEQERIIDELSQINDVDDRFIWLIRYGRDAGSLTESQQIEKFRISGCTSQLWLVPALKDGKVDFRADSDAAIPKGLGTLFAAVYSELTPEEALQLDASFLEKAGVSEHLSMNR